MKSLPILKVVFLGRECSSANGVEILFGSYLICVVRCGSYFLYPYAVNFRDLGTKAFWEVLMYVRSSLSAAFYIIKKGALKWKTRD